LLLALGFLLDEVLLLVSGLAAAMALLAYLSLAAA